MKVMKEAANYIINNREELVSIWEKKARREIISAEDSASPLLRNHLSELLEDLSKSLEQVAVSDDPRKASEKYFIKSRSQRHGESRSDSSDSYKVDEVLEEYVLFRHVITDQLFEKGLQSHYCTEAINRMFELASLRAVKAFMDKNEKSRQKLLSTLIHDIRSPLSVAISALGILESFLKPDKLAKEMYGMVDRSQKRSLDMITSSLDLFSNESRSKLVLNFEKVNLSEVLEVALGDLDQVYGRQLKVKKIEKGIEGIFAPKILVRVLENLISNAFKFGDLESPVCVSLTKKSELVELTVHNWGDPIPKINQESIFEMFRTTSISVDSVSEGWGLGLALIRLAANAHGGSIELVSNEEVGTEFKVLLKTDAQDIEEKEFTL
jgi:hypothetical protein